MTKKSENFSFWDYSIPQVTAGIAGASKAIESGDGEWAESLLDSTASELARAKAQVEQQIGDRDAGTYKPSKYHENGQECPRSNPKHKDYEPEVPPDRNAWRRQ